MQTIRLGSSPLFSSRLAYGCWRIAPSGDPSADLKTARAAILSAIEAGFTLFDHADVYCDGRAESAFGEVLREHPELREKLVIATKCGIRFAGNPLPAAPGRYDFSKEYILRACEGSLGRLGIDCIDLFQLHRPDWLMNPDEVAEAFSELRSSGKVREFGVSNFRPSQVTLLLHSFPDLVVNQIELSLAQLGPFLDGTLDQCQAGKITPLAWSPLAGGMLADGETSVLPSQKAYRPAPIVAAMDAIAVERGVSRVAVALSWLLKHPAGIVPIIGSTQPGRIRAAAESASLELTREEWYRLLIAARGEPLP